MSIFFRLCLIVFTGCMLVPATAQTDSSVFGNKKFLSDGLLGKVYDLPDTTNRLPDFDTLKAVAKIYSREINIPIRNWTDGFPGATDKIEWFGIDYKSIIKLKKQGLYHFRLLSDHGSKLFIDEKLIIDNDGQHSAMSKTGEITLDSSENYMRLQYFQGPRSGIALQLFVAYEGESEEIFSGNLFSLTTPPEKINIRVIIWGITIAAALFLILFFRKKRKKKSFQIIA